MAEIDIVPVTIVAGQSLSPQVDIGMKSLVGIVLPSSWVAATGGLSFQVSHDGGTTFNELTTASSAAAYVVAFTGAGPAFLAIDPSILRGVVTLKVRSGLVGAGVAQTNGPILQLITRLVV